MRRVNTHRPKWRVLTAQGMPWSVPIRIESEPRRTLLSQFMPYVIVTATIVAMTLVLWKIGYAFTLVNTALLYLLPVLLSAVRWGLWPSFYAAALGVIGFDFFFVPPLYTYTVADIRYLVSFAVYLAVATFTASLASQLRQHAREAREREQITSALYALSTQVAAARDLNFVLHEIVRHAYTTFGLRAAIALPNSVGDLSVSATYGFDEQQQMDVVEPKIIRWVYDHAKMAGLGTSTHKDASLLYVPLKTESRTHGVLCISGSQTPARTMEGSRFRVVHALAGLAAVSIARIHLEEEAKIAHLTAESERLRTALLDSISHELRTPLATIIGAVTGLLEGANILSTDDHHELLLTVREGAMRMNRLVSNLLGMVRLESGMLRLNRKWCDVSDIVGVALGQVQESLLNRHVDVNMSPNLPVISVDEVLIEQVLVNLLSNAVKYSEQNSPIRMDVLEYDGVLTIQIRDWGIGIQNVESEKLFEKFYRSDNAKTIPGTGLGLAICKGIVEAHSGEIFARSADGGGTVVTVRLPVDDGEGPEW